MSDDLKLHLLIAALHSEEPLEFAGSASNRGQNAHTVHMCDIVCHVSHIATGGHTGEPNFRLQTHLLKYSPE